MLKIIYNYNGDETQLEEYRLNFDDATIKLLKYQEDSQFGVEELSAYDNTLCLGDKFDKTLDIY